MRKGITLFFLILLLISCGKQQLESDNDKIVSKINDITINSTKTEKTEGVNLNSKIDIEESDNIKDEVGTNNSKKEKIIALGGKLALENPINNNIFSNFRKVIIKGENEFIINKINFNKAILQFNGLIYSIEETDLNSGLSDPYIMENGDVLIPYSKGDNVVLNINGIDELEITKDEAKKIELKENDKSFLLLNGKKVEYELLSPEIKKFTFLETTTMDLNSYKKFVLGAIEKLGTDFFENLNVYKIIIKGGNNIVIHKHNDYHYFIQRDGVSYEFYSSKFNRGIGEMFISENGDILLVSLNLDKNTLKVNDFDVVTWTSNGIKKSTISNPDTIGYEKEGDFYIFIDGKGVKTEQYNHDNEKQYNFFKKEKGDLDTYKNIIKSLLD